ncbi:MAG: MJ0042-type zinc finger domain-containing protein, partial [Planctomycetota bacterium]
MKLICPECQAAMSVSSASLRPGTFKPSCKQCGKRFVLKVSSDTPPKVRVSKASPDRLDAQKRSVSTKATTTLASQRSAASREAMEATQADSVATQPRSSATGAHSVA